VRRCGGVAARPVHGLEASEYLCRRYGWQHGTLQTLDAAERYELVVCYDVLQYLDTRARRARRSPS
jgi:2-polyprenyl-3-methyl-5-hydroxy-6-metoxy-1,4-benzoquinol methylase